MGKRPFFKHYAKIFKNEFRGYSVAKFMKDTMAGLTVAAVSLPLALAFGAAGMDTAHASVGIVAGLITAIFAGLIIAVLGGGSFQISGPTGTMSVVLVSIVAGQYGLQGVFLTCFLAGLILFLAGLLRLGKLIQFIPRPVVTGFTSGIAVIIALGQIGNFFGVPIEGVSVVDKVAFFFTEQLDGINGIAVLCALLVMAIILFFPKKWGRYVPGSLVALVLLSLVVALTGLDVKTIGHIPSSLINEAHLEPAQITPDMIPALLGPAATIAALAMIESLLCGVCASKMKNEPFDSNVELVAQGVGNMAIAFFGGLPATAALARTSMAIKGGGQTRVTAVMQSLFLVLCMLVLPGVIGAVPYAALAGVLVVTAWRMNDWAVITSYFKKKMWDAVTLYLVTMVATVFLDLTYAILIGVVLSLVIMVVNTKIDIECSPVANHCLGLEGDGCDTVVVYTSGSLFFANAGELEKTVKDEADSYENFIFVMRGMTYLDVSSVDTLFDVVYMLSDKGKSVSFTGVRDAVYTRMQKSGFVELVGEDRFYPSLDKLLLEESDEVADYLKKQ